LDVGASRCAEWLLSRPHFEMAGAVDDENTLSVAWFFVRVPRGPSLCADARADLAQPIRDENGRWITSHVINQDIVAWVGQAHRGPHQGKFALTMSASR